jgi:tetratricopeptide (TPR) repeat protein
MNAWYGSPVSAQELESEIRAAGLIHTTLADFAEDVLRRIEARHDLIRLKEYYFRLVNIHGCRGNLERCIECCDAGVRLAADLGMVPVLCHTTKANMFLRLGRYDAACDSLQAEITDDEHLLARGFNQLVSGMYLLELMAFERASTIFETVAENSRPLQRHRLARWAQSELARALIGARRLTRLGLQDIAGEFARIGSRMPAELEAEIALFFGQPARALERAEAAVSLASDMDSRNFYVSGREVQLRALLQLGRPAEVVALADGALRMAWEMGYRPMVWRLQGARARALAALGRTHEATQEHEAAATLVRTLAQSIPDPELKRGFLSRALASLTLAAANSRTTEEVK